MPSTPRRPYRSLADLLNAARAHPGDLTLASVGPATTLHISAEKLKRATHTNMTYIPFSGSGPTVNSLLGEHVTAVFAEYPAVAEQLKAGKLRALATGSPARIEALPELPTVAESGYPGFEVDVWWGVFAPARRRRTSLPSLPPHSPRPSRRRRSKQSWSRSVSIRSVCAARISPPTCADNMTNTVAIIREANIKAE